MSIGVMTKMPNMSKFGKRNIYGIRLTPTNLWMKLIPISKMFKIAFTTVQNNRSDSSLGVKGFRAGAPGSLLISLILHLRRLQESQLEANSGPAKLPATGKYQ
jgi:hypothetical protein